MQNGRPQIVAQAHVKSFVLVVRSSTAAERTFSKPYASLETVLERSSLLRAIYRVSSSG
jgi:hypothetical protein